MKRKTSHALEGEALKELLGDFRKATNLPEQSVITFIYITKEGFPDDACRAPNIAGCKTVHDRQALCKALKIQFWVAAPETPKKPGNPKKRKQAT
jgi:hypothetical protein